MRVLVIKPILPYPADQGTKAVTLGLLQALGRAHDVTLVCRLLARDEERFVPLLERETGARVRCVLTPNRRSPVHRALYGIGAWAAARRGVPRETYYDTPAALHALVRAVCDEAPVDIAVVENWHMAPMFASVRARRRVLLAHDAEPSVWATRLAHAAPADRAARTARRDQRIALERAACQAADVVLALTAADRRTLRAEIGGDTPPLAVLPFAPQSAPPASSAPSPDGPPTVLFFGSFHGDFNRDAAGWLVRDIAPRLFAALPECRLVLAGSGEPGAALREAARDPRIVWGGYLDDPARALREATVVVLPLRVGGGLHVRLFDAWAQGAAVVTTSLGVEGLPFRDGHEVRVADDADSFAAAVVDLARDAGTRHRLGAAARARLEAEYGRERVAERIREIFAAIGAAAPLPSWSLADPAGDSHGGDPPTA